MKEINTWKGDRMQITKAFNNPCIRTSRNKARIILTEKEFECLPRESSASGSTQISIASNILFYRRATETEFEKRIIGLN